MPKIESITLFKKSIKIRLDHISKLEPLSTIININYEFIHFLVLICFKLIRNKNRKKIKEVRVPGLHSKLPERVVEEK